MGNRSIIFHLYSETQYAYLGVIFLFFKTNKFELDLRIVVLLYLQGLKISVSFTFELSAKLLYSTATLKR